MNRDELILLWRRIKALWPTMSVSPEEAQIWLKRLAPAEKEDVDQAVEDAFAGGETKLRLPDLLARIRGMQNARLSSLPLAASNLEEYLERDQRDREALDKVLEGISAVELEWCWRQAVPNAPKILEPNWNSTKESIRWRMAAESVALWLAKGGRQIYEVWRFEKSIIKPEPEKETEPTKPEGQK